MAEEIDRAAPDRQAIWVALKTLRQRPTVVGRTDEGATVYELRSVELVLPPGAAHFKRLVPCAKCRRRVPGSVVLGPADLDRSALPVFCDRCGRAVDRPMREAPRERWEAPAPAPPQASQPVVTEPAADAERLAAVEAQLAEVRAELRELAASNRALERALGELDARMAALTASADDGASRVHALEQRVQASVRSRRPPEVLLESLERQLREAEERLGQL